MPMDVTQTSSGQQQMLCSMLSLASALKDNSIVLIDEPELSLHPKAWETSQFRLKMNNCFRSGKISCITCMFF